MDITRDGGRHIGQGTAALRAAHTVKTAKGRDLRYDSLLVAVGGRLVADIDHAPTATRKVSPGKAA